MPRKVSIRNAIQCLALGIGMLLTAMLLPSDPLPVEVLRGALGGASVAVILWGSIQLLLVWRASASLKARRLWPAGYLFALVFLGALFTVSQQDNVLEAVLRHEAEAWRSDRTLPASPRTLFVSFAGQDPSDGFIQRFRHGDLVVLKPSQGMRKTPSDIYSEYWVDPATGLKGGKINLVGIRWFGPFVAQVDFNYSLDGYRDTVSLSRHGWAVTDKRMQWEY